MKTILIGTKIDYKGNTLKIVEAHNTKNPCKGCFFDGGLDCVKITSLTGYCGAVNRDDKKDVIFKKVE